MQASFKCTFLKSMESYLICNMIMYVFCSILWCLLTSFWLLARKMLSVLLLLPPALIKPSTVHEGWQGFKGGNVKLESTTK